MGIKKRKKRIRENPNQLKIRVEWLPSISSTWFLRACPNDSSHCVRGTCFSQGGRTWFCPECGVEWAANVQTGFIKYYSITPSGGRKLLKKRAIRYFPEVQSVVHRFKLGVAI